jgi:hypothetical protein
MSAFKQDLLSRFVGTDEGEVTEYLGCEIIRDREARTAKIVQSGYAERVLKTFGMWDCNPVKTPLDANNRLSKRDCPEVVDSHLSKFVQYPGMVHLEAAESVLEYVRGTYNHGWVDSDFASDIDSRKSMTGYLMSFNGGPISWKSSRQDGLSLSSSEAEFVAASQAGQEVVYLMALFRGFWYTQRARLKYGKIPCRAL